MAGYKSKTRSSGKGNTGKKIGDKGVKGKGNARTRQVADRYK